MSDYTNNFDGSTKDTNEDIIQGAHFDSEFDNIASVTTTKANKLLSPVENDLLLQSATGDLKAAGWRFTAVTGDVTSSQAELNLLDGCTSTTADLNLLAGQAAGGLTATELGYVNGVTSDIQTQLDGKASSTPFRGALAYSSSTIAVAASTSVDVPWNLESYDTDSIHDISTNNERVTVPAGVTKVRVFACIRWTGMSSGERASCTVNHIATGRAFTAYDTQHIPAAGIWAHNLSTGVIPVTAGDYFYCSVSHSSASSRSVNAAGSWISMEIIE